MKKKEEKVGREGCSYGIRKSGWVGFGQVSPVLGERGRDRSLGACRMHNFRAGDCSGSAKIRLPLVAAG
jgi:hypothetical protein